MSYYNCNCVFSCTLATEAVDNVDTSSINVDAKENFAVATVRPNTMPVEEQYGSYRQQFSVIKTPVYHSDGHNLRKFMQL